MSNAVEIYYRAVTRWEEARSGYKVRRIVEIFNMFDILPLHHNKLGSYNRS